MDLSIVIVSYNTSELLADCLSSVCRWASQSRHEIVVVDNASDDDSVAIVTTRFPEAAVIRNAENLGFARAVNQGIGASRGRYILLLNSDATLVDDSARTMMACLDAEPCAAAVGGTLLNADGTFQGSYADFPTLWSETLLLTGLSRWLLPATFPSRTEAESQYRSAVDWVCGAFIMLRRAAVADIGLLDEAYFMYAEEVDWCRRARRRGWKIVYLPEARTIHLVGGSYGKAPVRRRAQIYRSKWLYFGRNEGRLVAAIFRVLVQVCSVVKLGMWACTGLSRNPARRERAQRNVASYRHLLANF